MPVESSSKSSEVLSTTLHKSIKNEYSETLVKEQLETENTSMTCSKKSSRKRATVIDTDTLKLKKA